MDIKKLLGDYPLSEDERRRVADHDALLLQAGTLSAAVASNPGEALGQTVSGLLKVSHLRAMGVFQDQKGLDGHGLASAAKTVSEHLEAMARNDLLSRPSALAHLQNDRLLASMHDRYAFEEFERKQSEKLLNESADFGLRQHHRMERLAAEARELEQEKLEYARRSAEASEENLAAANQRAAAAEAGQARAEKRETRMFWITVVALIITAVGAGASVWALLK